MNSDYIVLPIGAILIILSITVVIYGIGYAVGKLLEKIFVLVQCSKKL